MPFHLMKIYIRNPEIETKLFLCHFTFSDTDGCAADTSAHIYARRGSFSELGINGNLGWRTVGEDFFCFCQKKNKNDNLGWGTLEDALRRIQDILLGYLHTEATVVPSIQAACMQVSRNWLL